MEADSAVDGDGSLCVPFSARVCADGDSYWTDSCGNLGELAQECESNRPCYSDRGYCCYPAQTTSQAFAGVPQLSRTSWAGYVDSEAAAELTYSVDLLDFAFVPTAKGQGLRHIGKIDGKDFRFGINTHVADVAENVGVGITFNGYIEVLDESRGEAEPPAWKLLRSDQGGLIVLSTFVSLAKGDTVRLHLSRDAADDANERDWFAFAYQIDGGPEVRLGRVAFAREVAGTRASIAPGGTFFSRVNVADVDFDVNLPTLSAAVELPFFDDVQATNGQMYYPNLAETGMPFPNVDVVYNPLTERMVVSQGQGVSRCGEPGLIR